MKKRKIARHRLLGGFLSWGDVMIIKRDSNAQIWYLAFRLCFIVKDIMKNGFNGKKIYLHKFDYEVANEITKFQEQ